MHQPKPWFRKSNQTWYVQLEKQIPLVKGADSEQAAWDAYHALMAARGSATVEPNVSFAVLGDLFLVSIENGNKATFDWYSRFVNEFCDTYRGRAAKLTPSHVEAWLLGKPRWGRSTRRGAIVAVKRVIAWAIDAGHLAVDPLKKLKRPRIKRREQLAGAVEHDAIAAVTDQAFRDVILALRQTGARPGEVRTVEARHFDAKSGTWVFPPEECVKKSEVARVVYLTDAAVEMCQRLATENPRGPLFRNSRGRPWTRFAIRDRLRRLKAKGIIPEKTVAYSFRHGFATDALGNGVHAAELQQLLGHKDLSMISAHYGHLDQRGQQLREAAKKATG